ncbi:hypothetical protein F9C28_17805 [Shimwellia pseudoproteus]|uniref:copper-binding protein n=1 Tax=Shimwellia pseudoproteus TaxID=570012 RepID=UPI0018EDD00F|nr:copper-binding protein [Shimwellia pseudoproteus]MBJ3816711.1 hypothetical protein [Shimwellia pseudoproteus]
MMTLLQTILTGALFSASLITFPALAATDHAQMAGMAMSSTTPAAAEYSASGVVKAVNNHTVTIAHQAIPQLNWPPMTMRFDLSAYRGAALTAGQHIAFTFHQATAGYALDTTRAQ